MHAMCVASILHTLPVMALGNYCGQKSGGNLLISLIHTYTHTHTHTHGVR